MIRNPLICLSYKWLKRVLYACAIGYADDPSGVKRPDNAHAIRPEQDKEQ
jgi:hypothetical protein